MDFLFGIPKYENTYIHFPLGHVIGLMPEVFVFRKRLIKSLETSVPNIISSTEEEFIDCLEELNVYRNKETKNYSLIRKGEEDLSEIIDRSERKIYGYIGFSEEDIDNSFRDSNFITNIGNHYFFSKRTKNIVNEEVLTVPSLCQRKADAFLIISLYSKNNNIFLSHKEITDICEDNEFDSVIDVIKFCSCLDKKENIEKYKESLEKFDYKYCLDVFDKSGKNLSKASLLSGLDRKTFRKKLGIAKYEIED